MSALPLQHPRASTAAQAKIACAAVLALTSCAWAQTGWEQLGGRSQRHSVTTDPLPSLGQVFWTRTSDINNDPISFTPQSSPVVGEGRVFATGRVSQIGFPSNQARLFCFDAFTGQALWGVPVSNPGLNESFSTPCIDPGNHTVIHGSGRNLAAYDTVTGTLRWTRQLTHAVVNASPTVTTDRPQRNRCFITDYDGRGTTGRLYCINVDPFNAALNPYLPGEIVWLAEIGGSSGNSPAYLPTADGGHGMVYVASVGDATLPLPGSIYAFNVDSAGTQPPVWCTQSPGDTGFFGGLVATTGGDCPQGGAAIAIYAATYAFSGKMESANLVKICGDTGTLEWTISCNRTSSIPVPLPDHKVLLSSGIDGFGSHPSLELFEDHGEYATRLWNTVDATWVDADGNGDQDAGEFLAVGGWSLQPIVSLAYTHPRVLCGVVPHSELTIPLCNELFIIDLGEEPDESGFVLDSAAGSGGTASFSNGLAYSIGTSGLIAYGSPPSAYDVDENGAVSIDDLCAWEHSRGRRDVNQDGLANATDRALLIGFLRRLEKGDMEATR